MSRTIEGDGRTAYRTALILIGALVLTAWLRAYSFGAALGWKLWPHTPAMVEPLDCDEAVYAYIGHRLLQGDVLYRDVTETRPPAGYWLYTLAVAAGGYNELTVRVLPVPFALATVALVWLIALRFYGPAAAAVAALLEAMLSNDPFVFGNGANFELFMNPLTVASLYLAATASGKRAAVRMAAAGACLGTAALFKQVVVTHLAVYLWFAWTTAKALDPARPWPVWKRRAAALLGGAAGPWIVAAGVLAARGALLDFLQIVFIYGPAMAAGATPAHGWQRWSRFFMGNPSEAWWGRGSWPAWAAAVLGAVVLLARRPTERERPAHSPAAPPAAVDRLLVLWTLSCCLQVMMPGLYWQHYYALAVPGVVLLTAAGLSRLAALEGPWRASAGLAAIALLGGIGAIQYRDYLALTPDAVTTRAKSGWQWVVDRAMGIQIRNQLRRPGSRLFIWGWQSPLQFYSRCDSVTPYFFTDPLMTAYAHRPHPLVDPRKQRIVADLQTHAPELVFIGQRPFLGLAQLLNAAYRPIETLPGGLGLWIRADLARYVRRRGNEPPRRQGRRED